MAMQTKKEKLDKQEAIKQIVIDASNATLGRLSSFVAKQLLIGTRIIVINSEKAVLLGDRKVILQRYAQKRRRGRGSLKGPYFPSNPEAILKRTIRGMLSYKSAHGIAAFKNLTCYASVPSAYKDAKKIVSKRKKATKYITLGEISRLI